ncbi:MAG TPA: beta-ketoacyl synthase N-terminal-like domain-containing protein [Actinophytocola sp.]|uniref:beta-ketoacyl synthase N-terminal-like domain-containing protein n=1 Tax=Actinophytocola sp. TaxID=1872138 RepID=UPI002DDD88AF|nr:beta-ketoacyl synthase N-terminal-like domain-containing protein [Actinophytocola sp.]HEV2781454.1 beta-ketoacyl synthase N-terminal-like domain-containing protein [Actinophytocola sp.]
MTAVITAWSAVSPFGYGRAAFADGLRAGRTRNLVPDFVIADHLGAKGTGSMDRSSALAVATVGRLLKDDGPVPTDATTGVVLGTTSGSTRTQFEFTSESLVRRKPYFVNPAVMPYALMNSAAAQCAIWHRLTGPNSTIANGRMSGLVALRYALRLLAAGRATGIVCGAVEEHSEQRELVERHLRGGADVPVGEGCAVLFLEPAGTASAGLAEVAAVHTRLAFDAPERALAECLRDALRTAGVRPGPTLAVALSSAEPALRNVELSAVDEVLGRNVTSVVEPAALLGDAGAVAGMFQVAALLSLPASRAQWAAVPCADRDGMVGCALLRLPGAEAFG